MKYALLTLALAWGGVGMPASNLDPAAINEVASPDVPAGAFNFQGPLERNGNLYALVVDDDNSKAQFRKSTDDGVTWTALTEEATLNWGGGAFNWFWDPFRAPSLVTFFVHVSGGTKALVDYDIDTETWGAPYATVGGPASSNCSIVRLSDATVKVFYFKGFFDHNLYYAIANTAGSGAWDSTDNVFIVDTYWIPVVNVSNFLHQFSAALDDSDTAHMIVVQKPVGVVSNTYTYAGLDSGNVISGPTDSNEPTPTGSGLNEDNLVVLPDGKLYFTEVLSGTDKVYLWTGEPLTAPVFTREVVADMISDPATNGPIFAYPTYVNGQVTVVWGTDYDQALSSNIINYAQKSVSTGLWGPAPWGVFLDLNVNFPQPPITSGGPFPPRWFCDGVSAGPVSTAPLGIGVIFDLDTAAPNDGLMAFYALGAPVVPPTIEGRGGGGRFFAPIYNCHDGLLQVNWLMWSRSYGQQVPTVPASARLGSQIARSPVPLSGLPRMAPRGKRRFS